MPTSAANPRPDLLDPVDVARLGGLELTTDGIVEGFLNGQHRSPRRGFSVEFAEHRGYQAGDDLRYIDWKLAARNDRLYIKQYEEETNLRAMLVCDASQSMAWSGGPATLPKLEWSKRFLAALALVLLRQRDATGLLTFDDDVRDVTPPRSRLAHWELIARTLNARQAGHGTAAEPALRRVVDQLKRRGLVVFASDLLMDRDLVLKALRFLRARGHTVVVAHVMDPAELTLEGTQEVRLTDAESDQAVVLRPKDWADAYAATVARTVAEWRAACRRSGIRYHLLRTDTPFGTALHTVLSEHARGR